MIEEKLNEGLALVQLYPGPIMVDLTPCVDCRLRSMPGAVLASVTRRLLANGSQLLDSFP
jgi:chromate transport protein ChrA